MQTMILPNTSRVTTFVPIEIRRRWRFSKTITEKALFWITKKAFGSFFGDTITKRAFRLPSVILTQQKDTIDHHVTKTTTDTSEEDCVRVWVALKDRGNAVAYVTVKTFGKKVYVDIRDYWYPNGLQGGITPTKRGVCLNLEGWLTLVQEMDTIEELWFDAEQYLRRQPVIIGGPVDSSDEGSQLVVLD